MSDNTLLDDWRTMAGLPLSRLEEKLNEPYDNAAIGKLPSSSRNAGKPTIKPEYVRARVNKLFGAHGVGWRFTPHPTLGREGYTVEERRTSAGEIKTWHVVALECWVFEYQVIKPDGTMEWIQTSPLSDLHENLERKSAYRGALSSLLKQAVRSMNGFESLDGKPGTPFIEKPKEPPAPPKQETKPKDEAAGLTRAEAGELIAWTRSLTLADADVLKALGVQSLGQWTKGLKAARERVSTWLDEQVPARK